MDTTTNYEAFIDEARNFALDFAAGNEDITAEQTERLLKARLTYGIGHKVGRRGVCFYDVWKTEAGETVDLIEICALGQENLVQLAGTTIHELAHVLGRQDGHGKIWKDFTLRLGFHRKLKVGDKYHMSMFHPALRARLYELMLRLTDGTPNFELIDIPRGARTCSAGAGTKGGTSRGKGSGSRLRLYECACETHNGTEGPWKVRIAADNFEATCDHCKFPFMKVEAA